MNMQNERNYQFGVILMLSLLIKIDSNLINIPHVNQIRLDCLFICIMYWFYLLKATQKYILR